jgi:hydroxymethylbilane synthase
MRLRIGSRGSLLALWQAEDVRRRLETLGHEVAVQVIVTTGDRVLDRPLESVGGKGAFLKEIEEALLAGEVDLAVHSLKDVPTALPPGLGLCAVLEREDPRDALLSGSGVGLSGLPQGARIGTTSLRRRAQLLAHRRDLVLIPVRGNVDTRIRKLRSGEVDAIVLALAGLRRLGRASEASEVLDPRVMLPAPGQGAIALEARAADHPVREACAALDHPQTARRIAAERAFLEGLGGGCNTPLGALAEESGGELLLRGLVADATGTRVLAAERTGADPSALGAALAEDLLSQGARELLGP